MVVTAPAEWERTGGFMRRIACTRAGERGGLMWVQGGTRHICTGWSRVSKTLLVVQAWSSDTCPSVTESGRLKSLYPDSAVPTCDTDSTLCARGTVG